MDTYQEKRQKAINELRNENKVLVELSLRNANNIKNAYESLSESLKNILSLEDELTLSSERIKKTKDSAAGLGVLERVRDFTGTASAVDTQRSNNAHLKKSIQFQELKLKSISGFILNGFKEVARSVRSSVSFRSNYVPAINCESELRNVIHELEETELLDAVNFFRILKSKETKETVKSLEILVHSLNDYKPKINTERIRLSSLANMRNLCNEVNAEKNAKIEYSNSLEGRVLAYVTYLNASKREEEIETADIEYFSFLESKQDEKLSSFSHESHETLKTLVETLEDKEFISEDEVAYALVHIKRLYEKNLPVEVKEESLEDIRLRTLILEEDFDIPFNQSFIVAKMIKDEDIQRVYEEIANAVGRQEARLLVKHNPNLFILENGSISRYTSYLKAVVNDARRYASMGDEGIIDSLVHNPNGFASFEGLHKTQNKINDLENMVSGQPLLQGLNVVISTRALERAKKDNFVANSKGKYARMIKELAKNPARNNKVEPIGEFMVFPTGFNGRRAPRLAFHFDRNDNALFIDDLLYHESRYEYVGGWNRRAAKDGDINLDYYASKGYAEFKGEL